MARHGENIRHRKDGRWEGRYKVYNEEKGKEVYVSVYGKSYQEAKEKLTMKKILPKTETVRTKAMQTAGAELLFGNMAEKWLAVVKQTKKMSTYVKYTQVYKNHIEELFQNVPLSEMTDAAVKEKLFQKRGGSNAMSDSLLKSIYCILNQALKFASENYSVAMPSLKKSVFADKKKPVQALSIKEQIKLFTVLWHDMDIFKLAVFLCLHTGLRLGELCALKWADIDLANRILTVDRTVQRLPVEGHGHKTILWEGEPKSGCSRRDIPLSEELAGLLIQFQNGKEYIFGGDRPLEPRTMQNHFKKILGEAGLPDKNFHMLRHTFATNCVEGNVDVKSLSELLGHSDVRITLNRYVHSSIDAKRKHIGSLCMFYGQVYGQAC